MRTILCFVIATALVLGSFAALPLKVSATNLDTSADRVFGQPDFTSNTLNNGGLSANSLDYPIGVALDPQGNLYVADYSNNRVLEFDSPLTTDSNADRVFGQPDFTSKTNNNSGVSANSLLGPWAITLDAQGNLYVADQGNYRVLEYNNPLTSDTSADRVFGQPNFTSNTPNNGGVSDHSLSLPQGVAVDAQGNLYVADPFNNRVLEFDVPLTTDTSADRVFGQGGSFTSAVNNNGGISAKSLYAPQGMAVDVSGNLYVADTYNFRVLEFDSPLTTDASADRVFGQPDLTSNTSNGISANSLFQPNCVALDAQGDLYVGDNGDSRVLEYDTSLTIDTTADRVFGQPNFTSNTPNKGSLSANSSNYPSGVALDTQGNLYVADTKNNRLLEYDVPVPYSVASLTTLSPSTLAAGGPAFTLTVNGSGFVPGSNVRWDGSDRPTTFLSSTQLNTTLSSADVATGGPFAVTVFTPAPGGGTSTLISLPLYLRSGQDTAADGVLGQPNFIFSNPNNGLLPGGTNRLSSPGGVAIDPHSRRLFVADSNNHRVLSWTNVPAFANGQAADLVLGQPNFTSNTANGLSAHSLNFPTRVTLDAQGNLYVADSKNNRVLEYSAPFSNGMAAARVFGQGGSFTTAVQNNGGVSANSLYNPYGVALDARGDLYVADTFNNRVLEYDTPLTASTAADRVFGQPDFTSNTANGLNANSLSIPSGIALDVQGDLYVADDGNHRVLEYNSPLTAGATADQVFGQPGFTSNIPNNGGLNAHSLNFPTGVALDTQGDLFVADYGNNRVLEYKTSLTASGGADRVFGQPDLTSNTPNNGGLSAHSLNFPYDVVVDVQGDLYVADTSNHRVLEYDSPSVKILLPLIIR